MKELIPSKQILWNLQRNNPLVGFISGGSQCGYTSASRVLAQVFPELYNLPIEKEVDLNIAKMIDDMEPKIGKIGWGEKFLTIATNGRFKSSQRIGAFLDVYNAYIKDQVEPLGYTTNCALFDGKWKDLEFALDCEMVVMIGTMITPSGHFICLVGHDQDNYIALDPYGNALTNYKSTNGDRVLYPKKWLQDRCFDGAGKKGFVRYLYLMENK